MQDNYHIYDFVGRDPGEYSIATRTSNMICYGTISDSAFFEHVKSGAGEADDTARHFDPDIVDLRLGGFDLSIGSWCSLLRKKLEAGLRKDDDLTIFTHNRV